MFCHRTQEFLAAKGIAFENRDITVDPQALEELQQLGYRAIETLPIALCVVVILVDLEGCSSQETAAIVGCSVDLVAARLYRARRRLRDHLRHDLKPAASNPQTL